MNDSQLLDILSNVWRRDTSVDEALDAISDYIAEVECKLETANIGLRAVEELIDCSQGVSGLHHNGDIAPWTSLLEGGHYEEWLVDYSIAVKDFSVIKKV